MNTLYVKIEWDLDLGNDPDPVEYNKKREALGLPSEIAWKIDGEFDVEEMATEDTIEAISDEYGWLIFSADFRVEEA